MPSPFMTVLILVVLWLIVVVPMIFRRVDERRRDRSVAEWGRSMRALGRRSRTVPDGPGELDGFDRPRSEVFVTQQTRTAAAARRPVPAAQEALMYPPDRSEMSEARVAMLARRRRSLSILAGGSVVFGLLAVVLGGAMWLLAAPFLLGFAGYLWFLRNQALNDRSRRESRQLRAAARQPTGYDATTEFGRFDEAPESVVRIDDDDLELHSMDTIDLTGLYTEESEAPAVVRRAS